MNVPSWLVVAVGILATAAVITTAWSVSWDLNAYRAWKREETEPQPRHKRRQRQKRAVEVETEATRWRWLMRALLAAAVGFVLGVSGLVAGFLTRTAWAIVVGGNLLVVGVVAWIAYQLVLPKPEALRQKRLPNWMSRRKSA